MSSTNQCLAIQKNGTKCICSAKYGSYCGRHKNQNDLMPRHIVSLEDEDEDLSNLLQDTLKISKDQDIINETNIKQVLKEIHPDHQIDKEAIFYLNNALIALARYLGPLLTSTSPLLTSASPLLTFNEIILREFPQELAKHTIDMLLNHKTIFEISNVRTLLKDFNLSDQKLGEIALTLEYISAEILELAGMTARRHRKINITHIIKVIEKDAELKSLFAKIS